MDLEKLSMHLRNLASLSESESSMISCYINHEAGRGSYRDAIDARIRGIRNLPSSDLRLDFEVALGRIEAFRAVDVNPEAKGVALFCAGGESPFFQA
ncbi:MAG: hypothetical protein OEN01_14145 [Candidatus Krumholzibacteria bacterium]|nr:hypothetical protein [Candidatus Krumholzibacteria bacterium]